MTRGIIFKIVTSIVLCGAVFGDVKDDAKVISIKCGEAHTLVLTANKWVWGAGDNSFYQLGDETLTDRNTFVRVHDGINITQSGYLEGIEQMAGGWQHSLFLDMNNFVLRAVKNAKKTIFYQRFFFATK